MRSTTILDKATLLDEGVRLLDAKQPSAAISRFKKVIDIDCNSAGAYSGIGQAFLDMQEYEGARVALTKSIELNPTPARYVLLGHALSMLNDRRSAIRAYSDALRRSPRDSEALFGVGNVLAKAHPRMAAAALEKAIEADPSFGESYLELGALLNRTGRFAEARQYLEKATELKPESPWSWIELANSFWGANVKSKAEAILRDTAERFPDESSPLWTLAGYLEMLGRLRESETLFRQAIARQPNDAIARELLERFLSRHQSKH
jgi:tetratricopeptide (TPR) repeat protein